jgi:glycerol kinase
VKRYIGAIDQGTTSTRFFLLDREGRIAASSQVEHRQIYPKPGWVEHDAEEIWRNTCAVIRDTLKKAGATGSDIEAVGITNQRETTVVWDGTTGRPYANAIVWQDTRTDTLCSRLAAGSGIDRFRDRTGLPLATYFSGPKLAWLLENVPGLRAAAEAGRARFGTIDSWLTWQLTGGPAGGAHVTDVTNASRTLLLDLAGLKWAPEIVDVLGIPPGMLPQVVPSAARKGYGLTTADGPFGARIPLVAMLGDQQAALFGQACFASGEAKNTYGTGCFMLMNTGEKPVVSRHGLLTTVAYQIEGKAAVYALEGSVAVAGSLVQWFRDKMGLVKSAAEINQMAAAVPDNGGVYFVPAFSGLFAPHWRSDARGLVIGLTHATGREHMARAVLEATAFQSREIFDVMKQETGLAMPDLRVDGGMTASDLLMQFQSDLLGVPVRLPEVAETTVLGACYAAGLATGFFESFDQIRSRWKEKKVWRPAMDAATRERLLGRWRGAVERSFAWLEPGQ